MIQSLFILLDASAQGGAPQNDWVTSVGLMVAIGVIFYFFMIRPQNKKQKEMQKFRNSLEKGQQVVTIGGIHGKITAINEEANTITLELSKGTEATFERSAIMPNGAANK